jgi:hypothetical protein
MLSDFQMELGAAGLELNIARLIIITHKILIVACMGA